MEKEPQQAFPFIPPDAGIRKRYGDVFSVIAPLKERRIKLVFDKVFASLLLTATSPFFFAIFSAHVLLSLFIPDQRGKLLIRYTAVSGGKSFPKYKFRVIKQGCINEASAACDDWHAYVAEWTPENRTYLGLVLKTFYLDELPQLFNIFFGHMSLVGPRPLAVHHYARDLEQGNVFRRFVKAGLLGPSQALKGAYSYGNPENEYQYADKYLKASDFALLWCDLKIIGQCLRVATQAKGL